MSTTKVPSTKLYNAFHDFRIGGFSSGIILRFWEGSIDSRITYKHREHQQVVL